MRKIFTRAWKRAGFDPALGLFRSLALLLLVVLLAAAKPADLAIKDIRPMVEEMLAYHVEHKKLSSTLIQRAIKVFITQFDPQKIYFTSAEVRPYLEMGDRKLQSVIANYLHDEFG